MKSSMIRFVLAACLIVASTVFLRAHSQREVFPSRLPLQSFPEQLGPWLRTRDVPIDKDSLAVLGAGDFMVRIYQNQAEQMPYLDLYIAYFPSQRAGDTIHSPKNCLPGAGWSALESSRVTLNVPGHVPFPANRSVIAKGDARELVYYWYWAHDRGVASEYWAKYYLIADSIRMNRSDGALVRVTTPIYPGEAAEVAEQRVLPFVNDVVPQLQNYIPK